jgi:predicted PurR-regulated permease PerM
MSEQRLDISIGTIGKIFLAGFIFYVIFIARNIVIWFFFALIISILVEPAIRFFRWMRLPRIVGVIIVYGSILGVLGVIIYLTAPIFIFEITQLIKNIPDYFEKINPVLKNVGVDVAQNFQDFAKSFTDNLQDSSAGIFKAISTFFGGISSTLFIFTIAFFISLEKKGSEGIIFLMVPQKYKEYTVALFGRAQDKVSKWFGARILSCAFVGVASFVVFFLLGTKYPFILALISAVLNFVPYIGPTITLLLSVLFVGSANSWLIAGYIAVALLVIQEIENKVVTPLLMKRFMDMPPVLVIMSLLIGGTVFGFLGTLFSVPVFGIIYEFLKEFLEKRHTETVEY